jgi:DNA polymerase-3 subunit beta
LKIFVTGAALKASLLQAAKQDIRYYLNGICIETHEKETRVIASDGHRLSVVRVPAENEGVAPGTQIIIPRSTVEVMKISRASLNHALTIEGPDAGGEYRVTGGFGVAVFKAVEGRFPDYRRVVPSETNGQPAQYEATYLVDMQKAATLLGSKRVYVRYSGNGAAVVTCEKKEIDFVGVVMPQRWQDKNGQPHVPADISWACK